MQKVIKKIFKNEKLKDVCYYALFSVMYVRAFIYTTMFTAILPDKRLLNLLGYTIAGVLLIFALANIYSYFYKHKWKQVLFLSAILFSGLICAILNGDRSLIILCVLIVAGVDRKFEPILFISVALGTILILTAYYASINGYIPYLVYERSGGGLNHAFGIVYRTDFAAHVLFLLMAYVWIRKDNIFLWEYFIILFITLLVWRYSGARINSFCMIMFLICYGGLRLYKKWKKKWPKIPIWICGIHIFCAVISYLSIVLIGNEDVQAAIEQRDSLGARLNLSWLGFKRFGVSLFGKLIEERGAGGIPDTSKDYFYLDIAYVRILIKYGILFLLLYLLLMTVGSYVAVLNQDAVMVLILAVIAIVSLIEHHATDYCYNIFIFVGICKYAKFDNNNMQHSFLNMINLRNLENNMKQKILKLHVVFSFAIMTLVIGLVSVPAFASKIDDLILLENINPTYWNYFVAANDESGKALQSTVEIKNRRNFIVNTLGNIKGNGYMITTNEDGSLTFSGKNKEKTRVYYIFCSGCLSFLPDGDYIYSDGGASDSSGLCTYVEGITYGVCGKKYYHRLASMPNSKSFSVRHTDYSYYNCVISIDPGYESEGKTIYPMIRKADDSDNNYEPCLTTKLYQTDLDTVQYKVIQTEKIGLKEIGVEDIELLLRETKSRNSNCTWLSLSFEDGTGIQIPINNPNLAEYGNINLVGIITSKSKRIDLNSPLDKQIEINKDETSLNDITGFSTYLSALKGSKYTVFISVKDEGTNALTKQTEFKMSKLGLNSDFIYGSSFLAVIDNKRIVYEKCEKNPISYQGILDNGTKYQIKSSTARYGSISSIVINDIEYSMNRRGMNFVIYDKNEGHVVDTVAFDTYSGLDVYRVTGEISGINLSETAN